MGATNQLVKLIEAGGEKLSELTEEGFDIVADAATFDPSAARVRTHKKEIPLVVRTDYLQLNQKVKTK